MFRTSCSRFWIFSRHLRFKIVYNCTFKHTESECSLKIFHLFINMTGNHPLVRQKENVRKYRNHVQVFSILPLNENFTKGHKELALVGRLRWNRERKKTSQAKGDDLASHFFFSPLQRPRVERVCNGPLFKLTRLNWRCLEQKDLDSHRLTWKKREENNVCLFFFYVL